MALQSLSASSHGLLSGEIFTQSPATGIQSLGQVAEEKAL